jgi:hypothetical protein
MSLFEFVLAFTSVISALGVGHVLYAAVHLLRGAARVQFSLTQALWMWSVFAMTLGNWAADWALRSITEWPAWSLLLLILSKIAQYVLCVFVTPDIPADGRIDLKSFYERESPRFLWVIIVFCAIALAFNFAFGGAQFYGPWLRDSVISIVAAAVTLIAIFVRLRWVQLGAAVIFSGLATYFLLAASNLGAA